MLGQLNFGLLLSGMLINGFRSFDSRTREPEFGVSCIETCERVEMYGRYYRGIRCPFPMKTDIFPAQA